MRWVSCVSGGATTARAEGVEERERMGGFLVREAVRRLRLHNAMSDCVIERCELDASQLTRHVGVMGVHYDEEPAYFLDEVILVSSILTGYIARHLSEQRGGCIEEFRRPLHCLSQQLPNTREACAELLCRSLPILYHAASYSEW